jgi:SAM-dependent methyltransferase
MVRNQFPISSAAKIFDKFADKYDQKYELYQPYIETYKKLASLLPPDKHGSVLDIGCGPAHALKYLINKGFELEVFGIDLSPNMLRLARKNVSSGEFRQLDCRNLDVFGRKFDVVICGFCIPYLEPVECSKLIEDIATSLKPEGIGYISAIEGDDYHVVEHVSPSGDSLHIHHHPSASLLQEFARVGLEVMDIERKAIVAADGFESLEVFFYVRSGS